MDLWDVVLFVLVNTVALVVQVGKNPCLIKPTVGSQHHPWVGGPCNVQYLLKDVDFSKAQS